MKNTNTAKFLAIVIVLVINAFIFFGHFQKVRGAAMTSVKDTLSTAQLSYFGRIDVATTATSVLFVGNSGPSNGSVNLFVGQTLAIGRTSTDTTTDVYYVRDIPSSNTIELNQSIGGSNAVGYSAIIATNSAIHTVTFTPVTQLLNGKFQVLLKATSTVSVGNSKAQDGIPDQDGFDLGQNTSVQTSAPGARLTTSDVYCSGTNMPANATGVGVTTIGSINYIYAECTVNAGTSNALAQYTITIGSTLASTAPNRQLINPAPATGHVVGQAGSQTGGIDVYAFSVRHIDSSNNLVDVATGKIAVTESVRVTATVDPTISFIIDNIGGLGTTAINVGQTICGYPMGTGQTNVTGANVPFGSLVLGASNDLAQRLSCITNSKGGYSVTVGEIGQMHTIGTTGVALTIPDTGCDSGSCAYNTPGTWNTAVGTTSGYGYSLQNINATNIGTTYISVAAWSGRPFRDITNPANAPVQIMWNTNLPTAYERAYVCYKVSISTLQAPGNYENEVNYVATATF